MTLAACLYNGTFTCMSYSFHQSVRTIIMSENDFTFLLCVTL